MEHQIIFTPQDFMTALIWVCGALITISSALAVIAKAVQKIKAPEMEQNQTLKMHEEWLMRHDKILETHEAYFKSDKKRLDSNEEGNRVSQKALLAILSCMINSNDSLTLESVKKVKEELEQYLITR